MSTNYYFRTQATKDGEEPLHIGLSAGGYFMFHAHTAKMLISKSSWMAYLTGYRGEIVDEYDKVVSLDHFKRIVALTPEDSIRAVFVNSPVVLPGKPIAPSLRYRDGDGYLFCNAEFS